MVNKLVSILCCFSILVSCYGAIWKTEDAYIIDDNPDDETQVVITESSNSCTVSSGAQGQCVTVEECNGPYNFFGSQDTDGKLELLEGLQRYLNLSDFEPCTPAAQNESSSETTTISGYYVCCTSLKYANVRSITLDEYYSKNPNEDLEVPEIPLASTKLWQNLIVRGTEANPGEFPFVVSIISRGQHICGGSLIDAQWVLSAAHCFDRFNSAAVRQLLLKVGDHNIATAGEARHQDIRVAKLFLHPGFFRQKGYFKDDVALIKLKTPVSRAANVGTVVLHNGSPGLSGQHVGAKVIGWGKTCAGSCPTSSVLRKGPLTLITNSQCSQSYYGTQAPPITNNMICATGRNGVDACNGDSGGPLVFNSGGHYNQIGIVSWGIGCGQYPGVYTRVSSFVSWISKHKQKG